MNIWIWRLNANGKWSVFAKTRNNDEVMAIVEGLPSGTAFLIGLGPIVTIKGVVA